MDGLVDDPIVLLDGEGWVRWASAAFESRYGSPDGAAAPFDFHGAGAGFEALSEDRSVSATVRGNGAGDEWVELEPHVTTDDGVLARISEVGRGEALGTDELWTILDTEEDGVYLADETWSSTWVNETAAEMIGMDVDQLIGLEMFRLLDESQQEMAERNLEYLLDPSNPDVITFEMTLTDEDGEDFPVESRSTLLPGEGFTGTVGIFRDISERKERERELEATVERLETFADTVSHDLRNPLTVAASHLHQAAAETDGGSEHLDAVADQLERMEDLVEDLLTLARQGRAVDAVESRSIATAAEESWSTVATSRATLRETADSDLQADPGRL